MKIILIIILALFTLSSCKFSYDKAKVEESYGSSDGGSGGGGGDSGGGGGGSPTCDPDPAQSTINPDPIAVADNGATPFNVTLTINDCNGLPFTADPADPVPEIQWQENSVPTTVSCTAIVSGTSTCAVTSSYAEDKTFQVISPSNLNSMQTNPVTFTKPPLTLNLTACLAGDSSPMSTAVSLPFVSPFSSVKPHKFLSTFPNYFTNNEAPQPYIPPATAVDWVLIQLYDASTGASVDAKSGFIHTNGSILDPSGNPISFSTSISPTLGHNYNINIIHRNHLSIGLYNPINNASGPLTIDLTSPGTEYLGETPAGAPVASPTEDPYVIIGGLKCLRPGDFNQDFKVDTTDRSNVVTYLFGASGIIPGFNYSGSMISIPGYYNSDITLNGSSYIYDPAPVADWAEDVQVINNSIMTGTTKPIWGNGLTVP